MRKTIVAEGFRLFLSHPLSIAAQRLFSQEIVLTVAIGFIHFVVAIAVKTGQPFRPCDKRVAYAIQHQAPSKGMLTYAHNPFKIRTLTSYLQGIGETRTINISNTSNLKYTMV